MANAFTAAAQTRPPNVIVFLADDLGYGDVAFNGGAIPTPNIDSIATGGVRFTSGYACAPVCNPSRAGFLTGRYPQRWGQESNLQSIPPDASPVISLPRSEKTFGEFMKDAGYATAVIGKWNVGRNAGYHPLDRGFEYFCGSGLFIKYVDPAWPDARFIDVSVATRGGTNRNDRPYIFLQREPMPLDIHVTDRFARECAEFIERKKDQPFFLYVPHVAPHVPLQTINTYYERFPHIQDESARLYAGMVSALDDAVGVVLDKLRETDLEDDTLVVFSSDNGPAFGDYASAGPFVGRKCTLYEGGIRVPFAMRWKGRLPEGKSYTAPVSLLDILPTALALAGGEDKPPKDLDGVNLLPYLEGSNDAGPDRFLFWRSGLNRAVRKGPWKLLVIGDRLVRLYNVETDSSESSDRATEYPEIVEEMMDALEGWEATLAEPRHATRKRTTKINGDRIEWDI